MPYYIRRHSCHYEHYCSVFAQLDLAMSRTVHSIGPDHAQHWPGQRSALAQTMLSIGPDSAEGRENKMPLQIRNSWQNRLVILTGGTYGIQLFKKKILWTLVFVCTIHVPSLDKKIFC